VDFSSDCNEVDSASFASVGAEDDEDEEAASAEGPSMAATDSIAGDSTSLVLPLLLALLTSLSNASLNRFFSWCLAALTSVGKHFLRSIS
jgi:hypothetical protein